MCSLKILLLIVIIAIIISSHNFLHNCWLSVQVCAVQSVAVSISLSGIIKKTIKRTSRSMRCANISTLSWIAIVLLFAATAAYLQRVPVKTTTFKSSFGARYIARSTILTRKADRKYGALIEDFGDGGSTSQPRCHLAVMYHFIRSLFFHLMSFSPFQMSLKHQLQRTPKKGRRMGTRGILK